MAKQIKAIKCPQCGSANVAELRNDYYKCNNCGTAFILDNDKKAININRTNTAPKDNPNNKKIFIGIAAFIVGILMLNVLGFFSNKHSKSDFSAKPETEEWTIDNRFFFETDDQTPIYVKIGKRSFKEIKDQPSIALYNASTGKLIALSELPINKKGFPHIYSEIFDDGTPYFIVDEKFLYRINTRNKVVQPLTASDFPEYPNLLSGFAKIEFSYFRNGVKVVTNDNKVVSFFPIANISVTPAEEYDLDAMNYPKALDYERAMYLFSDKNSDDNNVKLIKYIRHYANGFPAQDPYFQRDGTPKFADYIRNTKIISYKDLTPGRQYFNPKILAFNEHYVLLACKPSPAEDAPQQIQLMDVSGKVLWTISPPVKEGQNREGLYISAGYLGEKGIFITTRDLGFYLSLEGKIIQQFNN